MSQEKECYPNKKLYLISGKNRYDVVGDLLEIYKDIPIPNTWDWKSLTYYIEDLKHLNMIKFHKGELIPTKEFERNLKRITKKYKEND